MQSCFTASFRKRQTTPAPKLIRPSRAAPTHRRTLRSLIMLWLPLLLLESCTQATTPSAVPPGRDPAPVPISISVNSAEENVTYRASLIQDHLGAYLDFVGSQVLPVMSDNIDRILQDLQGLTDIRPGFFYHGHLDYLTSVPSGMDALMDMNNVIIQYHTLENPLIYILYWREELRRMDDPSVQSWLDRVREYQQVISTPSAASTARFRPLTESEARDIALRWDEYRRQNGLSSPGSEMLTRLVYLVDGGMQPHYQDSFQEINRFHSIAFRSSGYVQLENRTHFVNTFSPFEITFESVGKCQSLMPVFEQAQALGFGYILNIDNLYVAQHPELIQDPNMVKLSERLRMMIQDLPDDNLIQVNNPFIHQPIAFFAVGNYIFIVDGSLDSPSIFR